MPLDPATSRGTLTAQVTLGMPLKADLAPGSSIYTVAMDVTNFAAERVVMGHKVEAAALKVNANNQGYWIRGDVKINSIPANLDYRKPRDNGDAEIRLQATLDEARAASSASISSGMLSGPVPIKVNGRMPANESDSRLAVEADLTPVEGRQSAARLVEGGRQVRARDLHDDQQIARHALRGHGGRGARHLGQGRARGRRQRQYRDRELPGLQPVRRRQDHAQGRPRAGRHAAGDAARRRL